MAVIDWDKDAWQLYNDYLENAKIAYGTKTARRWERELLIIYDRLKQYPVAYPIEELLQDKRLVYRYCHMMNRRFKLIYFYDKIDDVVTIMDIWDIRMDPKTLTKRIR
jgi:hypothetical protein